MNTMASTKPKSEAASDRCYVECASLDVLPLERRRDFTRIARAMPVVIDGRGCWSRWDEDVLDVLERHYGRMKLTELRTLYGSSAQIGMAKWEDEEVLEHVRGQFTSWTVSDYLKAARRDEAAFYLANLALRDFPEIKRRYRSPDIGPRNLVGFSEKANAPELFVGASNTQYSNLHVDGGGGSVWCVCLSGEKEWIVFPPSDSERLCPFRTGDLQLRHSMLDPWSEESCARYRTTELHPVRVFLKAGQALFLPPNWWHITRNHGLTVTLNERVWWWQTLHYYVRGVFHSKVRQIMPGTPQPYVLY